MQPAQYQQAQPDMVLVEHPVSVKPTASPAAALKPVGCCRWVAAVVSVLVLLSSSVFMLLVSPGVVEQMFPEDLVLEPNAAEILRRQFQTHRPKVQRFSIHVSLGRALLNSGQVSKAAMHFDEALELAQSQTQQAEARHLLGTARWQQGRLSDAEGFIESAMGGADQSTGPVALRMLADIKFETGDVKQALRLYNEAFDLADQRKDFDAGALLAAAIGEAYASRGKAKESATWFDTARQVLDSARASPAGADELAVAKVESLQAHSHLRAGRTQLATNIYRKALRTQAKQLSPSHPDLIASRFGLARSLRDAGEVASALTDLEALEHVLRAGPQEGPQLSRLLLLKADLLREHKQLGEARLAAQEAMRLQAAVYDGQDHPDLGLALSSYGSVLHDAGELEAAQEQYQEALAISRRTLGRRHPRTAAAYGSLGSLFQDRGNDEQARAHFAECLDLQLAVASGQDTPDVAGTLNELATVLYRLGRFAEARPFLQRAVDAMDGAGVPRDHPDRALYQVNLEVLLATAGER